MRSILSSLIVREYLIIDRSSQTSTAYESPGLQVFLLL